MPYGTYLQSRKTPQSQPIPGREQEMVRNDAGGYVFSGGDELLFRRFLILGAEGGTYYVDEKRHVIRAGNATRNTIRAKGVEAVREIEVVSVEGRAPRNTPALVALSLATHPSLDAETRRAALIEALPKVARIGTHLFQFAHFMQLQRGWGRLAREGIANWYLKMDPKRLAYQVLKYQARKVETQRWSHRDLLRLAHPKPQTEEQQIVFRYITQGDLPQEEVESLRILWGFERIKAANSKDEVISIIRDYNLTWEFVPGQWLGYADVWRALLPNLPYTALLRNLGRLSHLRITRPFSDEAELVVSRLTNPEAVRQSRVHPITIYIAMRQYGLGHGERGSLRWIVDRDVLEALEKAFLMAFQNVEPAGKRLLLGIDVSGSMGWGTVGGLPITPREGAALMALVTAKTEPKVHTMAFSHQFTEFPIHKDDTIESITRRMRDTPFGNTDCSLPMIYALKNRIPVDAFVVYTDNETWYGKIHPVQALEQYRQKMGIPARLIVVGMTATNFTIADPEDPGTLDVVGFDTATPRLISDFAAGRI